MLDDLGKVFRFALLVYIALILTFVTIILVGACIHYFPVVWRWMGVIS